MKRRHTRIGAHHFSGKKSPSRHIVGLSLRRAYRGVESIREYSFLERAGPQRVQRPDSSTGYKGTNPLKKRRGKNLFIDVAILGPGDSLRNRSRGWGKRRQTRGRIDIFVHKEETRNICDAGEYFRRQHGQIGERRSLWEEIR